MGVVGKKNFYTDVVGLGVLGRKRGDRNRRDCQVRVDKSENRALSAECPICVEGIISRDLKLFGSRKMGFLEENEVILIVGKKGD